MKYKKILSLVILGFICFFGFNAEVFAIDCNQAQSKYDAMKDAYDSMVLNYGIFSNNSSYAMGSKTYSTAITAVGDAMKDTANKAFEFSKYSSCGSYDFTVKMVTDKIREYGGAIRAIDDNQLNMCKATCSASHIPSNVCNCTDAGEFGKKYLDGTSGVYTLANKADNTVSYVGAGGNPDDVESPDFFNSIGIIELDCDSILGDEALELIDRILGWFQILAPILLIVFVALDLTKAVLSGDEKTVRKATGDSIKRAIAAIALFFVPLIIRMLFKMPGVKDTLNIGDDPLCGILE